jgi:hypothetical protein
MPDFIVLEQRLFSVADNMLFGVNDLATFLMPHTRCLIKAVSIRSSDKYKLSSVTSAAQSMMPQLF